MPKAFYPAFTIAKNKPTGSRPYIIIGINWGGGVLYYGTKSITVGNIKAEGKVLSVSAFSQQAKSRNMGSCSSISIVLDDGNGDIRNNLDVTRLEKRPAIVFQGFDGLSSKDLGVLLYGEVTGPIEWNEGNRSLSFSITSEIETNDVGYSPTEKDFPDLAPEAYNTPWPMVFGEAQNVPAVRVRRPAKAVLASGISFVNNIAKIVTLPENPNIGAAKTDMLSSAVECTIVDLNTDEENVIHLEESKAGDLATLPTDKDVDLEIDGVLFTGRYYAQSKTFKVSEANKPLYSDLKLGPRDPNDRVEKARTKDKVALSGYDVFWLADDIDLTGKYVYFKGIPEPRPSVCYKIVSQVGKRCTLNTGFTVPNNTYTPKLLTETDKIEAVYTILRAGHTSFELEKTTNNEYSPDGNHKEAKAALRTLQEKVPYWSRPSGTTVKRGGYDPEIYVVSCVELAEIYSVSGTKKEALEVGKDLHIFKQLPKNQYTQQLQSNFAVGGDYASAIFLSTALDDLDEGKWSDTLRVSCRSTVGPNVTDVIRYLIRRYTSYNVDNASFNAVQAQVNDYPVNFAYLDRENVLKVCEEIAWQSRCALFIDNQTVYLRYLGAQGLPSFTFNSSNIKLKSLSFAYTDTTDIVTRLLGSWTPDYRDSPKATKFNQAKSRRTRELIRALTDDSRVTENQTEVEIYDSNIDLYGLRAQESRFYIYNNQASVLKGLNFWGPRLANSWKIAKFTTFLPALHLQVFDTVLLDLPEFFNFGVYGVILSSSYSPDSFEITLEVWLPIKAGGLTVAGDAYGS